MPLKLVATETLIDVGSDPAWIREKNRILGVIKQAIAVVHWPEGARNFTIYPQSGKKRGEQSRAGDAEALMASLSGRIERTVRGAKIEIET